MATLERRERTRIHKEIAARLNTQTSMGADSVEQAVEQLMLEPMEYDEETDTYPNEPTVDSTQLAIPNDNMTQALQSLELLCQTCLITLDKMLQRMAAMNTTAVSTACPSASVMESIAQSTNHLARATFETTATDCCTMTMSHLQILESVVRLLDSSHFWILDKGDGAHTFGRALAALAEHMYRILDRYPQHAVCSVTTHDGNMSDALAAFEKETAGGRLTRVDEPLRHELNARIQELKWCVLNYGGLPAVDQAPPPAYTALDSLSFESRQGGKLIQLPGYCATSDDKQNQELESLLSALERLSRLTPRYDDQRVALTHWRNGAMPPTALNKRTLADGVSDATGDLLGQQHSHYLPTKSEKLHDIFSRIFQSVARTFDQSSLANVRRQKKPESEEISFRGGEPIEPWSLSHSHMTQFTDLLVKPWQRPQFIKQLQLASERKERDLFLDDLLSNVNRLEGRRMSDQDAEPPHRLHRQSAPPSITNVFMSEEYNEIDEELQQIVDHIYRAKRSQLDNQRAMFSTDLHPIGVV